MNKKLRYYTLEMGKIFLLIFIVSNIISYYKSTDLEKSPLLFERFNLLENKNYEVSKQKPILVHFWATWCSVCKVEGSNIDFIANHFEVVTIAVGSGDDDVIKGYLKQNDFHFNVANDPHSILAKQFNISVYPTTFIYDKEGNLVFSEVGYTSTLGLYLRMFWASF